MADQKPPPPLEPTAEVKRMLARAMPGGTKRKPMTEKERERHAELYGYRGGRPRSRRRFTQEDHDRIDAWLLRMAEEADARGMDTQDVGVTFEPIEADDWGSGHVDGFQVGACRNGWQVSLKANAARRCPCPSCVERREEQLAAYEERLAESTPKRTGRPKKELSPEAVERYLMLRAGGYAPTTAGKKCGIPYRRIDEVELEYRRRIRQSPKSSPKGFGDDDDGWSDEKLQRELG